MDKQEITGEARLNLAQLVNAGVDGAQEETFAFPPGTGPYPQLRSASSLPHEGPNI